MPRITGGFSTKDPDALSKIIKAAGNNIKLPFTATGFTSSKSNALADLVNEKKTAIVEEEVVEEKIEEIKEEPKKVVRRKKYGRRGK